ncbi:alpha-galactosidase [Photobacterium toruni]|uniref:alpha-galactosidase n=1 Tax=Photobacterium toruni TaxID=1935446 RepID=UPI002E176FDB|nr:alpha-galactosidase [Photobacterium toruni]
MMEKNKVTIPTIYSLVGMHSQLLIAVTDIADIIYYGTRLAHTDDNALQQMAVGLERPIPFGRLDSDIPVSINPQLGRGNFGSPALEGFRNNGLDWSPVFSVTSVTQEDHHLVIESHDPQAQLHWQTDIKLDHNDVLQISQTLINNGDSDYHVTRCANTVPIADSANEILSFYGRWIKEFQQHRSVLTHGGYIQENRRGRTSHEHYPAVIVGGHGFSEDHGQVWGAHLAWSGNHRIRIDVKADGRRILQAEALYLPGEITLQPQQSLTTPILYMSYSQHGLNAMSQQFHQYIRTSILKDRLHKPRPIHLNTWEGIYFDHDPNYISAMATEAAAMGIERFIIDDGWFCGRNDDTSSLGDWFIDKAKYPHGLSPIIEHVHQLGMEFGLWFEPEMINKDSDLYRQHPEWLLAIDGYEQPTGRHQYPIDLQNPAAFNYLFDRLDHFLSTYAIDYIKWDMNREIVQPAHNNRAAGCHQVAAYYALLDKLMAKHPNVEIESCAAGGGRIDYEVLKRTHRFWCSDNNDPLERQAIQQGMSYFYPPEIMGTHIGSHCSHTTRRTHSMNFRGNTALFGHMGLELDPVSASDDEKQTFSDYIHLHKKWRNLLHTGKNYRLSFYDNTALQGNMVISQSQSHALVSINQLTMPTYCLSGRLQIPGLDATKNYHITVIDGPKNLNEMVNRQPLWLEKNQCFNGEWLQIVGLTLPIMDPESSLLLHLQAQ